MISNQILQSTIDGLKNITRKDLSVVEKEGKVIATTEENMIGRQIDAIENFVGSQADSQLILGYQYFKVYDNGIPEYVIQVKGEDEDGYRIGKIAAFQIQSLLVAYKERYDKDNFIKNLLLDNLLLVDIYSRAKKLHIENNIRRIVYLIETNIDKDMNIVEIVRSIFPAKTKDFVTAVDEHSIILVKELREKETMDEIEKIAKMISDTLSTELNVKVYISIGTMVVRNRRGYLGQRGSQNDFRPFSARLAGSQKRTGVDRLDHGEFHLGHLLSGPYLHLLRRYACGNLVSCCG